MTPTCLVLLYLATFAAQKLFDCLRKKRIITENNNNTTYVHTHTHIKWFSWVITYSCLPSQDVSRREASKHQLGVPHH